MSIIFITLRWQWYYRTSEINQGLCQCATWLGHHKTHCPFDSFERKTYEIALRFLRLYQFPMLVDAYICAFTFSYFRHTSSNSPFPFSYQSISLCHWIGYHWQIFSHCTQHHMIPRKPLHCRLGAPARAPPKISVENSLFHAMCMRVKATEALINSVNVTECHF